MKQKQNIIILSALGFLFLLCWVVVLTLVITTVKNLRGSTTAGADSTMTNVTLCDEDASVLCIVNFGANKLNRMVINFQLPDAGYAPFYVKAANRGTVSVYMCEVSESMPTSAVCTGIRTPLGETIDVEVYTTDEDKLIARGTFLVSAIALSTPISLPSEIPATEAPVATELPVATDAPFITETPTPDPILPPSQ